MDVLARAIRNSLCFGLFRGESQIGFARVVTDYSRFGFLCDVFVLKAHRGKGLGKWLCECVRSCELLRGVRTLMLATKDAHVMYEKCGFERLANPDAFMALKTEMPWFRPELVEG